MLWEPGVPHSIFTHMCSGNHVQCAPLWHQNFAEGKITILSRASLYHSEQDAKFWWSAFLACISEVHACILCFCHIGQS